MDTTFADQDSDFMYVTSQPSVVAHAKYCYEYYPTIVNMIPKESAKYANTLTDFAIVDNKLSASQTDIGESSNLAQIAQTYDYNFDDEKFSDYVCILSVVAQIAIDSSKRLFDIDVAEEIHRIRKDMDIANNKYPTFWSIIKKGFSRDNINQDLKCPMNYLSDLDLTNFKNLSETLPMKEFFIKYPLEKDKKQCRKVEQLIVDYSLNLLEYQMDFNDDYNTWLLLRCDFDNLITDIKKTYISSNYRDLISWLIDRAFQITPNMLVNANKMSSKINKNKSLLLKILYSINPKSFLECFTEKVFDPTEIFSSHFEPLN